MGKHTNAPMNDALNGIDERYVAEFVQTDRRLQRRRQKPAVWMRFAVALVAVCLIAAAVAIPLALRQKDGETKDGEEVPRFEAGTLPSGEARWVDNRKKDTKVGTAAEIVRLWDFEDRTLPERYPVLLYAGKEYRIARSGLQYEESFPVSASLLGAQIGTGAVTDENGAHKKSCDIYEINGVADGFRVAARFEDENGEAVYLPYCTDAYEMPGTLGELFARYDLSVLSLPHCTVETDGKTAAYALTQADSDALFALLLAASDAPAVTDDGTAAPRYEIGFTLCSEALGIRNLALSLNIEGELRTNVDNYAYCYRIGTETVQKVLAYLTEHGTPTAPYVSVYEWTVGYVADVTGDTVTIDDSALMQNPADGMRFTVYADTLQVKRTLSGLKKGDLVVIVHRGIAASHPTEIRTAVAIEGGVLSEDGVGIPE